MATPTKPSRLGTYVVKTFRDESFRAYVPPPLPPDPPLALQSLLPLLEQANQALGRLDGLASILPDPSLFIYLYVRKEAVLSSQIEGTQSSFSDLMLFESTEACASPKLRNGLNVMHVTCYTISLYLIDFKCAPNFGEAHHFRLSQHKITGLSRRFQFSSTLSDCPFFSL